MDVAGFCVLFIWNTECYKLLWYSRALWCAVFILIALTRASAVTSEECVYYKCSFCSDHTSTANLKTLMLESTARRSTNHLGLQLIPTSGLTQNVLLTITQCFVLVNNLRDGIFHCFKMLCRSAHFKRYGNFIVGMSLRSSEHIMPVQRQHLLHLNRHNLVSSVQFNIFLSVSS